MAISKERLRNAYFVSKEVWSGICAGNCDFWETLLISVTHTRAEGKHGDQHVWVYHLALGNHKGRA